MRHELDFFNPWQALHQARRELGHAAAAKEAPLAIWIGEEGGKIRMPLPGIAADKLDISVLGEVVTLRGQRDVESASSGERYLRQERHHGAFHRRVNLRFRVDAQAVKANYVDGILTIILPRLAADKPQRISVQAA